jgi:4-hydroxyphenylpyruvate dioxygenase
VARLGFAPVVYKGLETGSREYAHHVVRQNNITFEFVSPYNPDNNEFYRELNQHGDFAKDVAFTVEDAKACYDMAIAEGATSVEAPHELKDDNGSVVLATIRTYGTTNHTFVERKNYKGAFLPGYSPSQTVDPFATFTAPVGLEFIDHCVGNQPDQEMSPTVEFYEKVLKFHRFWSVDDSMMHTEYSALRSIVVTDWDEKVKMPVNEPAPGKKKSQIQEYCDYNAGAGVQHIALRTSDVITAVECCRARGVKFLTVPKAYYTALREKLKHASIKVKEDLDKIEELGLLVDYDDKGYLLQIFTQPVQDRPTLFFELIQRNNHFGFGAGNFKALFEAIEIQQGLRGNL